MKRNRNSGAIRPKPFPSYMQRRIKGEGSSSFNYHLDGSASLNNSNPSTSSISGELPIDWSSIQGKFGWTQIDGTNLPFIRRGEQSFCSIRMMESTITKNKFHVFHKDLYSFTNISIYRATENEARLLNSINKDHCEGLFGKEPYRSQDLLLKLEDAKSCYHFLLFCYNKLYNRQLTNSDSPCGFLRINGDSVIAYTWKSGEKYVPLFYFDDVSPDLRQLAETLDAWDSTYLRFCCQIQGIREEHLKSHDFSVVKLSILKAHFPRSTRFEEYWPFKQASCFFSRRIRRQ